MGKKNNVKIPIEVYEEIKFDKKTKDKKEDEFEKWTRNPETKESLLLQEEVNAKMVSNIVDKGYAPDLTDDEVVKIGRDPFLIAYAMVSPKDRCIVTTESSKPSANRSNRRIPDVCKDFGISCINVFELVEQLNFSTDWKKQK